MITICSNCQKEIDRKPCSIKRSKYLYCSKNCKNTHQKTVLTGSNNPNYGKKWDEEQKENQSLIMKEIMKDPEIREKCKSDRSFTQTKEFKEKCRKRKLGIPGVKHTSESKSKIGLKSKLKFTPEFKEKFRQKMELSGQWIPLSEKSDYEIYYKLSNWIDNMIKYISDDDLKVFKEKGFFNNRHNTKGIVRDHIFSRKSGFQLGIFPEILRHPSNCQILTHANNISKRSIRYVDRDDITLEQLFNNIKSYSKDWKEQDKCVELITKYESGERWKNESTGELCVQ